MTVGTVGARIHSSQDLTRAINTLTAVGGSQDKLEILQEIKAAQDKYEKVLADTRIVIQEVRKSQDEANQAIAQALKDMIDAERKFKTFQIEKDKILQELGKREEQIKQVEEMLGNDRLLFAALQARTEENFRIKENELESRFSHVEKREIEFDKLKSDLNTYLTNLERSLNAVPIREVSAFLIK